jgi:hypothetical protein
MELIGKPHLSERSADLPSPHGSGGINRATIPPDAAGRWTEIWVSVTAVCVDILIFALLIG